MVVRFKNFSLSEEHTLYVYARVAFNISMLGLLALVMQDSAAPPLMNDLLVIITTAGTAYILLVRDRGIQRAVMHFLIPDLGVVAGMTFAYHGLEDAFFPAVVMLAVTYALVLKGERAWIASIGTTVAYAVGHALGHGFVPPDAFAFLMRMSSLPLVSLLVATTVEARRRREVETVAAVAEAANLNRQLRDRLSELQAVSDITDMIHSSLDFDTIGDKVLCILAKVIGVEACCLFVLGKDMSETLFSASYGIAGTTARGYSADPRTVEEHFTCATVYEHPDAMVLFCAGADEIESLSDENRLVLSAVSSELIVAVENSRLYKLTKTLAVTDELTGLHNYRHLQQKLDEEIGRAIRFDKRLSLLMVDIDDFKLFNDANGHLAGDQALADLGSVIKSAIRGVDMVARYGGEEFAVVLPETDAAGAFVAAEKIREAVSKYRFVDATGAASFSMTLSIGLSTLPTHAWDKESLLRQADDALYQAKNGGKNRVRAPKRSGAQARGESLAAAATAISDEWTGD